MNKERIFDLFFFLTLLLLQAMLFKNLTLFNTGLCFPYVAFILFMPLEASSFTLILLAFALGMTVDVFYDSMGLHTSALLCLAFGRNFWISKIYARTGYMKEVRPTAALNGLGWFVFYALPLIALHHVLLFFTEIGGFSLTGYTLLKALTSALFTFVIVVLLQYLLPRQKRT